MNRCFLAALLLVVLPATAIAQVPAAPAPERVLVLVVNTSATGFDEDGGLLLGGGHVEGYAIVCINGDPIHAHTIGGSLQPIGQWTVKGRNNFSVLGHFKRDLYVKIGWQQKDGTVKTIAKQAIGAKDDRGTEYVFDVPIAFDLPARAKLPQDDEKLDAFGKDARNFVRGIETLMAAGKFEEASDVLLAGQQIWKPKVIGMTAEQAKNARNDLVRVLSLPTTKLIREDLEREFNIIGGETMILMYRSDMNWDETPSSFRFKLESGAELSLPPLRLVKIDGKWVVWH